MRVLGLRWALAFVRMIIVLMGWIPAASADPITVTATPISSFSLISQQTRFGGLEWRGGLELQSTDGRFGGLSGLALSKDGSELLAVSDRGFWFRVRLAYADGRLAGIGDAEMAPILDGKGKPPKSKVVADAEALSPWTPGIIDGKVIVGFESRPRAGLYDLKDAFNARFKDLALPKGARQGPPNRELEAIGRLTRGRLKGSLIAISEGNRDANGDFRAWIWGAKQNFEFAIKPYDDYVVTDLTILPDGDLLTVERSFGTSVLPGMAIRRIAADDIIEAGAVTPQLVFSGRIPLYTIDNMEGIAVSESIGGDILITLVSDNNYNPSLQRTLLLQFALKP